MDYTVELSDVDGNACKVKLSLPIIKVDTDKTNSTWRTLDQGAIKFHSGGCHTWGSGGFFSALNLELLVGDSMIITLSEFTNGARMVNSSGNGEILQPACLSFKPGKITWALLE